MPSSSQQQSPSRSNSTRENSSSPSPESDETDQSNVQDGAREDIIDFEGQHDPDNPKNFPLARKWRITAITCLVSFVVGLNSTSITAAAIAINEEFHVSDEHFPHSFWPVFAWNTAAGILPMVALPLMESFGFKKYYLITYVLFTLFIIPQALAQNFATLIVVRVFAGAFGGILQNIVDGIIADLYAGEHSRSLPMTLYVFGYLGGVSFGPVFGGLITLTLSWRWIFYIQLIITASLFPLVLLILPETRPPIVLAKKSKHVNKHEDRETKAAKQPEMTLTELVNEAAIRPLQMLITEPALGFMTLLSSFAFGLVFISTQSAGAYVFPETFGFDEAHAGIVQVALFIGEILGAAACIGQNQLYWHSHKFKHDIKPGTPIPEARLPLSIFGSFVGLGGGLFFYGWTSQQGLHWILPAIGLGFVGFGIMTVVHAVSNYVTDSYASLAASAMAALSLGENIFAAWLPLSTQRMYHDLGFPWASSTLAFLALVMSFAPVVLLLTGHRVREKSSRTE